MNAGKVILLGLLFCTPLLDLTTASGDDETGNQLGQQAPQASPIFPLQASGSNAPPPAMVSGFFGGPPMPPSGVSSMPPQSSPFGQVPVLPCGLVGQACCRTPMGAGAPVGNDAITCLVSSGVRSGCEAADVRCSKCTGCTCQCGEDVTPACTAPAYVPTGQCPA